MNLHRTLASIEAAAAEVKADRWISDADKEQALATLRIEWRAARAHDCENWDGECTADEPPYARYAASGRFEFAYVPGTRHYDMG